MKINKKKLARVKANLNRLLDEKPISKSEIEELIDFFDSVASYYLKEAFREIEYR